MRTAQRWLPAVALLAVALLVLAPVVSAKGETVQARDVDPYGEILVGPEDMTLYVFGNDSPGETTCYDSCAENWPPLTVDEDEDPELAAGVSGTLDVVERTDGEMQVTYNDMPLYYYAADDSPGDTNGQGVGDNWYVVPVGATSFDEAHEMSEAAGEAEMAAADATGTPMATATAAAAPAELPRTGTTSDMALRVLAAAAVVLLGSGLALQARRARS
jgi:predicted lipoprotein with Yx(FWY)xxD motif